MVKPFQLKTAIASLLLLLSIGLTSCDKSTSIIDEPTSLEDLSLVPMPKTIEMGSGFLALSPESKIYSPEPTVQKLLAIFSDELEKSREVKLQVALEESNDTDIFFFIDPSLEGETYRILISDRVVLAAANYAGLASARTTLLQLSKKMKSEGGQDVLAFPVLEIEDRPSASYRGLLVDLARNWHSVGSIKSLIDLASFYKTNYIQLHFTDYQSYTLPSKVFPDLPTPGRSYTKEQLTDLDKYARDRGVEIIPELEMPGHAGSMVESYPELFGIAAFKENPWIINMGKEEVYDALSKLLNELIDQFPDAPYIHIGGDEAIFNHVMEDPDVLAYMKEHDLGDDVHELYRHFLVRINDIVRARGKQMAVWEGFARGGKVEIPKNILVYEFETNRYLPGDLIEDGYTVVNTSWKPIYVVNQKKWEPKTIYDWNLWRWENWFDKAPSIVPIQLEETNQIIGAQMCAWEQPEEAELPSLRKRLPIMIERIWNTKDSQSYESLMSNLDRTDEIVSSLTGDTRQDSVFFGHNWAMPEE